MKILSNETGAMIKYFREELKNLYPKNELENFIFLAFEHYLGFSKTDLIMNKSKNINEPEFLRLNRVVEELKQNKPIQYILEETEFYGLKFKVTPDVLIPRPETEEMVQWIINDTNLLKMQGLSQSEKLKKMTILDIGTGSGCIAIVLKKNLSQAKVLATDVSKAALSIARENAKKNGVTITFQYIDLLKYSKFSVSGFENYDIIVSNPPYVRISEQKQMEKNVLDYEPHLALFVGDKNPLLFYDLISDIALKRLKKNGKLYFEINEKYGSAIKRLIIRKGFSNVLLNKDIRGRERMICGQLK